MSKSKYWAIIVAAGSGKRMQNGVPKQYLPLDNKSIIEHSIEPFLTNPQVEKIMVVLAENDQDWPKLAIANNIKIMCTIGGDERYLSVLNGLIALQSMAVKDDWVLIHDAARPFITECEIDKLIQAVGAHAVGGLLGTSMISTVKEVVNNQVVKTIPRQNLWQAATPQMFRYELLVEALQVVLPEQVPSDCSQAIENLGYTPLMVECTQRNFKITCPADLELARNIVGDKN